jgi:hypothetical protein
MQTDNLVTSLQDVLAISSFVLSAGGALLAFVLGYFFSERRSVTDVATDTVPNADPVVQARIPDAQRALRRQESAATWYRRMSGALTASHYLVGAALASAFLQASLSDYWTGSLGLVVLLSQVVQQRYRPDLRSLGATERATYLRRLIREAEDELFARESGGVGAKSILDIRRMVSAVLSEIDTSEASEWNEIVQAQVITAPDHQARI